MAPVRSWVAAAIALALGACRSPGYDPANPGRVSCGCGGPDECYEAAARLDAKGETAESAEQLLYYAQCACFGGSIGGCNTISHFARDQVAACKAGQNFPDSCAIAGFVYRHGVQVPSSNGRSYDRDPVASVAAFATACSAGAQIACSYGRPSSPEEIVDAACLERARDGKLTADLPAQVGQFHVTPAADGARFQRDGRTIDDAEGKRLWNYFTRDVHVPGVATAGYGMYSLYPCADVDKRSCIQLDMYACQANFDVVMASIAAALDHAHLSDAALSVEVTFLEPHGPMCRDGDACTPMQHYSTHGEYLPGTGHLRISNEPGRGSCQTDGDCEPYEEGECLPWYLTGGVSSGGGVSYREPTFCGCVRGRCRWFQQK
jgi:hypothetical protein